MLKRVMYYHQMLEQLRESIEAEEINSMDTLKDAIYELTLAYGEPSWVEDSLIDGLRDDQSVAARIESWGTPELSDIRG